MKSHFFAYISRMRFIQRWALMRNTAPENVQEHSHQVAVLAHALAVIHNEKFGGCVDPGAVTAAALYHDASEILTGDMPTPIKYDNPTIQSAYKEVEAVAERKLLELLPPELRGVYKPILTPRTRRSYGWSRRRTSSPPISSAWRSSRPETWSFGRLRPRPGRSWRAMACRRSPISWIRLWTAFP